MFNTQAQKTALCQIDLSRTPEKQLKDLKIYLALNIFSALYLIREDFSAS